MARAGQGHKASNGWQILNYEIQMYLGVRHLQGYLLGRPSENLRILQQSALVEVKILHIRILADIFLGSKQKDDISVDDLLPNWRQDNSTVAHNLKVAYNKNISSGHSPKWYLNKFLAHPDKRRGAGFDWTPIIERMDMPLKDVFRTLPTESLEALKFFGKYLKNP